MLVTGCRREPRSSLTVVSEPWRTILTLAVGFGHRACCPACSASAARWCRHPRSARSARRRSKASARRFRRSFRRPISGSLRYYREGLIIIARRVLDVAVRRRSPSVGGALLAGTVPGDGHLLMILTAALLAFTAYRTGRSPRRRATCDYGRRGPGGRSGRRQRSICVAAPPATTPHQEPWRLVLIGVAAGGLSGLLGIGGGILMVPAFIGWVRLTIKEAVATSLLCVGVLAIPGTITHTILGNVAWSFAIPLSIGVIPGAQVGAHLAIRSSDRALRVAVAVVLGSIAVIYTVGEVLALT